MQSLFKFLALDEQFWKQKAGLQWFQDGDKNTKKIYEQVNGRRGRLQIKRIQNSEGHWLDDDGAIAEEACRFFSEQFHEDVVPTAFGIIDHVLHMVDMEQNQELLRQPTKEEVK